MRKVLHFFLFFFCVEYTFAIDEPIQPFLKSLHAQESQTSSVPSIPAEETLSETETPVQDTTLTQEISPNTSTLTDELSNESESLPQEQTTVDGILDIETSSEHNLALLETPLEHIKIDLPYTEHYLIDYHREQYLSNFGKQRLNEIMTRAAVYRPHIRKTLTEEGIPLSLEFLPVIESDFKTSAVSRSGATGIWQFMENSIAGLLEKNEWLDERHDPWLSTEAAAHKLAYNYSILKDWELALAAYNMGLGGLQRAITRAGSDDFWYLAENGYVPSQTKNYVPKFIAVADLVTNAEYYEIDLPKYDENVAINFIELEVNKQINLEVLANLTNIEYSTYQFLNPAFEYAITPPRDYTLRIPAESEAIVLEAIEKQDSTSFLESHRVVQGDTLWSLSQKYNTTVEILCEINNRNENAILSIGTILFLPILK